MARVGGFNFKLLPGKKAKHLHVRFKLMGVPRGNRMRIRKALKHSLEEVRKYSIDSYLSGPYPDKLQSRSGKLARSLRTSTKPDGAKITGKLESSSPYARIHEFGGVIKAKNKPYLHFLIDEAHGGPQWVKVSQVTMPVRPFMWPAVEDNKRFIERTLIAAYMFPLLASMGIIKSPDLGGLTR